MKQAFVGGNDGSHPLLPLGLALGRKKVAPRRCHNLQAMWLADRVVVGYMARNEFDRTGRSLVLQEHDERRRITHIRLHQTRVQLLVLQVEPMTYSATAVIIQSVALHDDPTLLPVLDHVVAHLE